MFPVAPPNVIRVMLSRSWLSTYYAWPHENRNSGLRTPASRGCRCRILKPGLIEDPYRGVALTAMTKSLSGMFSSTPSIHVSELAAAMLEQCLYGITQGMLRPDDLVRI
ncbi:hypothetical protein B0O99DRAFT_736177 [Bisporella sp. PMI_857]|nr:hypothetical protein B0O99DRAFT_736177 [Bisporella sp. PMI_857]